MSFAELFTRRLTNPRFLFPVLATAGSIGLAYRYSSTIQNESGKTFTGGDEWIDLKLAKSWSTTKNTKHFVFELPNKDDVSGLITASCLLTKYVTPKGNNVIRPYTPTSDIEEKGYIELVIKKYDEGKMSSHIHSLNVNDTLSFKGPIVKWKWEPNQYNSISLIGGGTGITPLYQLMHEITKNPEDKTKVNLYYGNLTEDDILLKPELDSIADKHKDQVKIVYFVDKATDSWKGETGYISKDYLSKVLPPPSSKDHKIFVCGPPGMYKALSGMKNSPTDQGEVTGALADLGYTKEHVYKF
ncbi:Piso0_004258 [Millerozyma farinosa CBS 7064]|uniref:NADH-cytochrome b5 reductase n=1 Tax=Pichia sorbitophila (strain ATCC MYA-4447 / BCRC 22081 / CBS 7064 / NBRC 10061 / NRRL Y-12695) TaxID=559304 RepID=G8Y7X4_PICSO|nr:Piso0_004258 [Millerozyma farinosa CBS 7064]CCE84704.1 Piso0_004258 [Millerozyma farinosa CBS 7064]